MDFQLISRLADQGMLFVDTEYGMSHSERPAWPNKKTGDKTQLQKWIDEGKNLVVVASHGHTFAIDVDDPEAAKAAGMPEPMLDETCVVDTPSGGKHYHGLHTPETEALGNLLFVRL